MDGGQIAAVIAKAVMYWTSLAGPGGALFLLVFGDTLTDGEQARIRRAALIGLLIAAIVGMARISIISGMLGGDLASMASETLIGIVLHAGEGRALVLRLIGLTLAAIGLRFEKARFIGTIAGVAFVCVSFAVVGHAEAAGPKPLPGGLLVLHLLGLTFWLGALYPLWRLAKAPDTARIAGIMTQFGDIALYVVGTLVIAGGGLLWILIGDPAEILQSDYGRLVTGKLGLVAVLLGLAALNRLRLAPRLRRGDQTAVVSLQRSIALEIAVAAAILLVTATFTTIVGPPTLG